MKYALIIGSIVLIILTLIIYFNLRKELKSSKFISKKYLNSKVNDFSILLFLLLVMSVITIIDIVIKNIK